VENSKWGIKIEGGYFLEEHHIYRNEAGMIVTSPTKTFNILGFSDFSMIDPATVAWKRVYGNAVHSAVQFMVADDLDWDSVDTMIEAPVRGVEQRLKEMGFKCEGAEEQRVACLGGMYYGMKLDLRGNVIHRGVRRKVVIDLKTGSKYEKHWMWQTAAYIAPQPPILSGYLGIVLQVDPAGKVTPHYVDDVPAAIREWQILLAAAILKVNNGYAQLGG
jgi:hypothetical protein